MQGAKSKRVSVFLADIKKSLGEWKEVGTVIVRGTATANFNGNTTGAGTSILLLRRLGRPLYTRINESLDECLVLKGNWLLLSQDIRAASRNLLAPVLMLLPPPSFHQTPQQVENKRAGGECGGAENSQRRG
ncbi:hypothetical protein E2C01_031295 [Portunus trituberculatus]|uniref:Uncharacterized protein n=1 Tax=Portunus trituberculatus TaxID=210409 RepID=A0A5B7EU47_PORTR|nr:hypothetical protein [Portunus trituberculatus]